MKSIYLVRETRTDGSTGLVEISGAAWYALVKENNKLPREKRRFFIRDIILDGDQSSAMIMEVSAEEYREWSREQQRIRRNEEAGKEYSLLSLDAPIGPDGSENALREMIHGEQGAGDQYMEESLLEELREALGEWKPWGRSLLEQYIAGHKRSCTPWLAETCGVSLQMARRYKKAFEKFVKEFFFGR